MIYILITLVCLILAISVWLAHVGSVLSSNQGKLDTHLRELRLNLDNMRQDAQARHQQTSEKLGTLTRDQQNIDDRICKHLINPEKPTAYAMDLFRNLLDQYTKNAVARSENDRIRWAKYEKHIAKERERRGI